MSEVRRPPRGPGMTDGVRFFMRKLDKPVEERHPLPGRDRPELDRSGE
jgi:hypothetical protein